MFGFKNRGKDGQQKIDDDTQQLLVAPGTEITYKDSLIVKYQQEHRHLQNLFNNALTALQQADGPVLKKQLRDLQVALRRHLLDEELNFYIYLRHCYNDDKAKQDLITKFKKLSKRVGLETFEFIGKVSADEFQPSNDESFVSELLGVGNKLESLFEAEEHLLYPIYKKPANL